MRPHHDQPYVDCALRLAKEGFAAEDVADVLCETARVMCTGCGPAWRPNTGRHAYAAKFSAPFNIAVAFVTGGAGLAAFTKTRCATNASAAGRESEIRGRPEQSLSKAYTGHVRMTFAGRPVFEERQPISAAARRNR